MSQEILPDIPKFSADRLTRQLYHLPAIIGRLGLSVANAQRALNADYVDSVKELVGVINQLAPEGGEEIQGLLKQLAPSRYQFTQTTLDFSADLSESMDIAGSVGIGAGFGAVVVNAGLSIGFGRDYRAAARITTILHAIPADQAITGQLLQRADTLFNQGVMLPPRTDVSTATNNHLRDIIQLKSGKNLPRLGPELPLSPLQQAERSAEEADLYRQTAETFLKRVNASKEAAEASKTSAEAKKNEALKPGIPADQKKAFAEEAAGQAELAASHLAAAKQANNEVINANKAAKAASAAAKAAKEQSEGDEKKAAETAANNAATAADKAVVAAQAAATAVAAATTAANAAKKAADDAST